MIELKDIAYTRLGTPDVEQAVDYATNILGLPIEDKTRKGAQFRSDNRGQTMSYFEGDPRDQVVAFEVDTRKELDMAATTLESLGHPVELGTADACAERKVAAFIAFRNPAGDKIEFAVRPGEVSRPFRPTRDIQITGFSHVGVFSNDLKRDEAFWTQVCNARVSDWIDEVALLRINPIHHTVALVPAPRSGLHHINHQVATTDEVLRAYHFMIDHRVPVVFGPGRHPTSGARFLYFRGPDGLVFEYSCGVDAIADEENHRPRRFLPEPQSVCMWGSRWNEAGMVREHIGA